MSGKQPQCDDSMEEDNRPPPQHPDNWVHVSEMDIIIHMLGSCTQCDEFVSHIMQASIHRLRSYREALLNRAQYGKSQLRCTHDRIKEQQEVEDELRRQLRSARREVDDLREDLACERSRGTSASAVALPPQTGPYDERQHNKDTCRKVHQA
jgi:hypothetical protein